MDASIPNPRRPDRAITSRWDVEDMREFKAESALEFLRDRLSDSRSFVLFRKQPGFPRMHDICSHDKDSRVQIAVE